MLIKNGFIISPASQRSYTGDIRIENGVIRKIAADIMPVPGEEVIDAAGLTVSPGLIDTHVHFRDPGFTQVPSPRPKVVLLLSSAWRTPPLW